MNEFLTLPDLAARYGLSKLTLRRMWCAKTFPAPVRLGRSLRWRLSDLLAWEESRFADVPTIATVEEPFPADLPTFDDMLAADFPNCDFSVPEFSAEPLTQPEEAL